MTDLDLYMAILGAGCLIFLTRRRWVFGLRWHVDRDEKGEIMGLRRRRWWPW